MAFTKESFGDSLFASVGRSDRDLPATLEALGSALVAHGRLQSLAMRLDDIGTLVVERQGGEPVARWDAPAARIGEAPLGALAADTAQAPGARHSQDIRYADRSLGRMEARAAEPRDAASPLSDLLPPFARQCGRLIMRDRLGQWSLGRLGQPLRLIGLSSAMRDLDRFVETAAASPLPVLLRGEFGTEKLATAAAIHCCGPQADQPFVAVDCRDPDGEPADWLVQAKGGTLYLSAVDCLSLSLQTVLPRHLPSRLALWPHTGKHRAPRIIASATVDPAKLVAQGRFSRELASELTVLETTLPTLRNRRGDLGALARDTVARLGFDADRKLTDELLDACLAYDWPENLTEFERLLGRLATMTGARAIGADDIRRHAPSLARWVQGTGPCAVDRWAAPATTALERWASRALDPDADFLELDPSLAKALRHLGTSFAEAIDLADLAAIGGTTPLRMSALFRSTVGVPFKRLLRQIRILAACELLASEPTLAITQLAFQVGFGDLSYFERSFRSTIGESPRQFRQRRRVAKPAGSPSLLSDSVERSSGTVLGVAKAG